MKTKMRTDALSYKSNQKDVIASEKHLGLLQANAQELSKKKQVKNIRTLIEEVLSASDQAQPVR